MEEEAKHVTIRGNSVLSKRTASKKSFKQRQVYMLEKREKNKTVNQRKN